MENSPGIISEFLKGVNLVYFIGIISAIISALWAYRKFLYEKQLEKFKDANINLFKTDKQEVLAAIATLAFFNRDRKFKQNTIDILLSRLYTELDYDITNAIASALIQYSNRHELKYIADELAGINRNFYFQTYPIQQMIDDLGKKWNDLNNHENNQLQVGKTASEIAPGEKIESEIESGNLEIIEANNLEKNPPQLLETIWEIEEKNLAEIKQKLLIEHLRLYPKISHELKWHKQVTGDTYSRIMRKASRISKLTRRQRKLEMKLYQNDFNFTHLAKITTSKCTIDNSALSNVYFADIVFLNIKCIKDTTFYNSTFRNCTFRKGKITGSDFVRCVFDNVVFNKIFFEETFFFGATFFNCKFINCQNIKPVLFFKAAFEKSDLPIPQESISKLRIEDAYRALDECKVILKIRVDDMRISLLDYQTADDDFPKTTE